MTCPNCKSSVYMETPSGVCHCGECGTPWKVVEGRGIGNIKLVEGDTLTVERFLESLCPGDQDKPESGTSR